MVRLEEYPPKRYQQEWDNATRMPAWESNTVRTDRNSPLWRHLLIAFSPLARTRGDMPRGEHEGDEGGQGEERFDLYGFSDEKVFAFTNDFCYPDSKDTSSVGTDTPEGFPPRNLSRRATKAWWAHDKTYGTLPNVDYTSSSEESCFEKKIRPNYEQRAAQRLMDLAEANNLDGLVQIAATVCFGFGIIDEDALADNVLRKVGLKYADENRDTTVAFAHLIRANLQEDRFYAALAWCTILDWIANSNEQVMYKLGPGRDAALVLSKSVTEWVGQTLVDTQNNVADAAVKFHSWVHFLAGLVNTCSDAIANILCPCLEIEFIRAIEFFMPEKNAGGPRPSHAELLINDLLAGVCTVLRYGQVHPYPKLEAVHGAKKVVLGKKTEAAEPPKPRELDFQFLITLIRNLITRTRLRPIPSRDYGRGIFLHGCHYLEGLLKKTSAGGRPEKKLGIFLGMLSEDHDFLKKLDGIRQYVFSLCLIQI